MKTKTHYHFPESKDETAALARVSRTSVLALLLTLLVVVFAAFNLSAQTAISAQYGPMPVLGTNTGSVYTNTIPAAAGTTATTFPFPALFTNTYTTVSAGLTNTNTVTNTITAIVDVTKEPGFCVQHSFASTSSTNTTNTVIWQWIPSLDDVTWDTANTTFYVTNVCNGTNQVNSTTQFSPLVCGQIGFFKCTNILVSGTAVITNITVNASGKRVLSY